MITKVKRFFQWALMLTLLALFGYSVYVRDVQPCFAVSLSSRQQLQQYQDNLDLLYDKTGNFNTLIGEVQGYRSFFATGAVVGTTISVPGLLTTDVIADVIVYSSAAMICGSTVIGRAGEAQIALQSRVWGNPGFQFNASFTQKGGGDTSSMTLTINTTGYSFVVNLATTSGGVILSSANAICDAINGHTWLSRLIRASTVAAATSFSTASFNLPSAGNMFTNQFLQGSAPIGWLTFIATATAQQSVYSVPPSYITQISSGNIQVSTGSPVQKEDGLELRTYGLRSQ